MLAASDSKITSFIRSSSALQTHAAAEVPERGIGYRSNIPIMSQSTHTADFAPVNAVWRSLVEPGL
jgi:hypothetical protein